MKKHCLHKKMDFQQGSDPNWKSFINEDTAFFSLRMLRHKVISLLTFPGLGSGPEIRQFTVLRLTLQEQLAVYAKAFPLYPAQTRKTQFSSVIPLYERGFTRILGM